MTRDAERGQGTVEWIALVVLVSVLVLGLGAAVGIGVPGTELARALASRLICAVGLSSDCAPERRRLAAAYGEELAGLVTEHAPTVLYEPGMRALPVDYRRCRKDDCAEGAETGTIWRSRSGEPVVAFTRAIDCRPSATSPPDQGSVDCSGGAAGNAYLQYWFYYPGSATGEGSIAPGLVRTVTGGIESVTSRAGVKVASYHPDDWETYQLRIGPDGRFARASSHRSYGPGWLPEHGAFRVSGGSHAGSIEGQEAERWTPADRLSLIPLEPIAARRPGVEFAITPPWRKRVWREPEYERTG